MHSPFHGYPFAALLLSACSHFCVTTTVRKLGGLFKLFYFNYCFPRCFFSRFATHNMLVYTYSKLSRHISYEKLLLSRRIRRMFQCTFDKSVCVSSSGQAVSDAHSNLSIPLFLAWISWPTREMDQRIFENRFFFRMNIMQSVIRVHCTTGTFDLYVLWMHCCLLETKATKVHHLFNYSRSFHVVYALVFMFF